MISKSEFLQLTGRAGRRGIDNKGFALLIMTGGLKIIGLMIYLI